MVTRGSGGRENGIKMVKRYKTPVKNSVSAGDVMYVVKQISDTRHDERQME